MLAVSVLVAFDKALIAYWFKPFPLQSDLLNRTFLSILKYTPVLLLISTATFIKQNYCMYNNDQIQPQKFFNEYMPCIQLWALPMWLYSLAVILCISLLVIDIKILKKTRNMLKEAYQDTDYFS